MTKSSKIIITILTIIVLALLARYVVFKEKFDEMGAGLQRIENWQNDYKAKNPNATKEEMDAAFDGGMANMKVWKEKYKQDNPNATDADADAALKAQFSN